MEQVHHTPALHAALRKRTKMAQGTLTRILTMIEDEAYCPDVIQQIDSVVGILHGLRRELLRRHLEGCVGARFREDKAAAVRELIKIYNLK